MESFFEDDENDLLEPAAADEEQHEAQFDLLEDGEGLPPLDGYGAAAEEFVPEPVEAEQQPEPEPEQQTETSQRLPSGQSQLRKLMRQGAASEEGKKKKSKKDKQAKQQQEQRGSRPKRLRQAPGEAAAEAGSKRPRPSGPELPEDEYVETAEDQDFIDDAGVPLDERYEEDDLEAQAHAEEAEEVAPGEEEDVEPTNPVDELLQGRKRRKKPSDGDIDRDIENLVSQMNACANKDLKVVENNVKKPAMEKFRHLNNVNEVLRQRSHHESFIQQDGLSAMANWLRPYPNGALPLLQIRNTLVDLLLLMNLDTSNEYTREKLEHSQLGKILMFYANNPHEKTLSLKTKCRDLILAWAKPIFEDPDAEQRKRRTREREHRVRMAGERQLREAREQKELAEAEKRRRAREGEEGFRARAAVPQPGRLDFVINPGSRVDPLEMHRAGAQPSSARPGSGKPKSPMPAQFQRVLAAKKRGNKDRIGGVSVEGRGMVL